MSSSVLLLFCVSIVLLCAQATSTGEEDEKSATDEWIRNALFGDRKLKSCANINAYPTRKNAPKASAFPAWTVVILTEDSIGNTTVLRRTQCTGSLIDFGVVLTSASCMNGTDPLSLVVRAGELKQVSRNNSEGHQERRIASVVIHEQFSAANATNDIALIFLTEPFHSTSLVRTVCLGSQEIQNELDNVNCTISGWPHKPTLEVIAGYIRFTTTSVTVVPRNSCQAVLRQTAFGENFSINSDVLCAVTDSNINALVTSGGAPLVCKVCSKRVIQVGVLSYGFDSVSLPFVLTAVHRHRKWIDSKYGKQPRVYDC